MLWFEVVEDAQPDGKTSWKGNLIRLILDELMYNTTRRMYSSESSAKRPDVYDPGQADVQPSGCTPYDADSKARPPDVRS